MRRKKKQKHGVTDGFNRPPSVTLITKRQWKYLQRCYRMTPRERQIAELVCKGLINQEIAEELNIRPGTVKTHLRNIYRRVRVNKKILMLLRFIEDLKTLASQALGVS